MGVNADWNLRVLVLLNDEVLGIVHLAVVGKLVAPAVWEAVAQFCGLLEGLGIEVHHAHRYGVVVDGLALGYRVDQVGFLGSPEHLVVEVAQPFGGGIYGGG